MNCQVAMQEVRGGLALLLRCQCNRGRPARSWWGPVCFPMGAALTPLPPALRGPVHIGRFDKFRRCPRLQGAGPWFATLPKGSQSAPARGCFTRPESNFSDHYFVLAFIRQIRAPLIKSKMKFTHSQLSLACCLCVIRRNVFICRLLWVIFAIRSPLFSIQMSKATYTETNVAKALQAVKNGSSLREAAKIFKVPK